MATTVSIGISLRRLTGGAAKVAAEGSTVREALADLGERYPLLRESLLAPGVSPQHVANFYVNGEDVRYREGLDTPLAAGDELLLLSVVSGGDWAAEGGWQRVRFS
ncbi:MAG: MoaD/ThiS family protein [Chloroflexi bacterium]|nr:MoaD/ThiS family protein [Chloroflexota bacterium]